MKPAPLTPLVEKEDVLVNRQHMHDLVVELLRFTQNRKTGKQPVGRAKIGAGQVVSVRGPRRPWTGRIQRVNKKAQTVQVEWLKPKRGYAKEATVHVDELVFG